MSAKPHLLYPDVFIYMAHIQIRLYRWGELVEVFAADALTQEQLEIGVLNRACDNAGCSMVNAQTLRQYHAIAETARGRVHVKYNNAERQFEATLT
jgi:hypothetical protein